MRWTAIPVLFALALLPVGVSAAGVLNASVHLDSRLPKPGAILRTSFPTLSAKVSGADAHTIRLFVDGVDVTRWMAFAGGTVEYASRDRIEPGWHDVFLEGADRNGRAFSSSWSFQTQGTGAAWYGASSGGYAFLPSGGPWFYPGSFAHFFLIAPPNGFAILQLCGLGTFPFVHQQFSPVYSVTVPIPVTPLMPSFFNCQVAALFTPINGFQTLLFPLPEPIGIFESHRHGIERALLPVYRSASVAPAIMTSRTLPIAYPISVLRSTSVSKPPSVTRPIAEPQPATVNSTTIGLPRGVTMPHPVRMMHPVYGSRPIP